MQKKTIESKWSLRLILLRYLNVTRVKKYIKLFEHELVQEHSFIRNSNYYYKLDCHSNSLSPVNMAVNEEFPNFFNVFVSMKSIQELSHVYVLVERKYVFTFLRTENKRSLVACEQVGLQQLANLWQIWPVWCYLKPNNKILNTLT